MDDERKTQIEEFHQRLKRLIGLCESDDNLHKSLAAIIGSGGQIARLQREILGNNIADWVEVVRAENLETKQSGKLWAKISVGCDPDEMFAAVHSDSQTMPISSEVYFAYSDDRPERWEMIKAEIAKRAKRWLDYPLPRNDTSARDSSKSVTPDKPLTENQETELRKDCGKRNRELMDKENSVDERLEILKAEFPELNLDKPKLEIIQRTETNRNNNSKMKQRKTKTS